MFFVPLFIKTLKKKKYHHPVGRVMSFHYWEGDQEIKLYLLAHQSSLQTLETLRKNI